MPSEAGPSRPGSPTALADAESRIGEDDLFTFIYTSGTTGPPKACKILHRNYYEMAKVVNDMADVFRRDDLLLLYLPLAHNFGRLTHLLAPMAGYTIAFCADPYAVADALLKVRPTVFPSVPRVYEKIHTAVVAAFDEATGVRRRLIDWALDVGRRVSVLRQQGRPVPRGLMAQHRLADRLVYSKVKARLGGRLRRAVSGGAPLAVEILEFFHALDILILEAYGLTECTTGATSNREESFKFGTVGQALPGWELKLAEDGELFIRSPTVFAGYYKDDEATSRDSRRRRLARDGRHRLDRRGRLCDDHRPQEGHPRHGRRQERRPAEPRERAEVLTVRLAGARRRRPPAVRGSARDTRSGRRPPAGRSATGLDGDLVTLSRHPDVLALVQGIVDDVNAPHSRFEQIKRFIVLPRDFSIEEGEVTPTLKLRRKICQEHFAAEIERLYDS